MLRAAENGRRASCQPIIARARALLAAEFREGAEYRPVNSRAPSSEGNPQDAELIAGLPRSPLSCALKSRAP